MGKFYLSLFGWKIDGGTPSVSKAVGIAYPHTSNWDLPFTLAICWALGLRINWLGKTSLFKPPFGGIMKLVGGIPVVRSRSTNAVRAIAESLADLDEVLVIIPPEGTRSKSGRWKSGFYWIAVEAKIPLVLGYLDYPRKTGGFGKVFWPSGDIAADMEKIRAFYKGKEGKHPELQSTITLED